MSTLNVDMRGSQSLGRGNVTEIILRKAYDQAILQNSRRMLIWEGGLGCLESTQSEGGGRIVTYTCETQLEKRLDSQLHTELPIFLDLG